MTAVPAVVVVISTVLPVAGVVLPIVRHQISQREAIVGCDEVDGVEGLPPVVLEEVRTATDPKAKAPKEQDFSQDFKVI